MSVMKDVTPTVFVVDDDEAVRGSLRLLFKSVGLPMQPFASAQDFLAAYDAQHPGCLVLDIRMPGMSGLDLQERLSLSGAIIPIIFITGHGDVPMAVQAMRHGAFDFLQKPFRDQDLIDRVQRAFDKDSANRLHLSKRDRIRERFESLTAREREVLRLVTGGRANKVIAGNLGVSHRTIEIHRARVMEKMEAHSLAELVRMTIEIDQAGSAPAAGAPQSNQGNRRA
jgi:two-component system, LuxR family, response regulator FixJ